LKLGNADVRQNLELSISVVKEAGQKISKELYKLGLLLGTGVNNVGEPEFELDRPLTRVEALSLILRLLGVEGEAAKYSGENPFRDVPEWAQKYAAYAFNSGLVFGVDEQNTSMDAKRDITYQEFTAMLLRVLGYTEAKGSFAFDKALDKSVEASLFTFNENQVFSEQKAFSRNEAAVALADALTAYHPETEQLFIYTLVDKGILSLQQANAFISSLSEIYLH
jgi:hypothetical protein